MSQQAREVFRSFRSNIEFTGVDNRAIVITSCLPADGKSTVSLRLAMTFAESEKKTVLVDADMRRSVLMRRVRAEGDNTSVGLSHVLSGQKSVTEARTLLAVVCDADSMYHLLCTDLLCADGGFCSCI